MCVCKLFPFVIPTNHLYRHRERESSMHINSIYIASDINFFLLSLCVKKADMMTMAVELENENEKG
jgi:hypothetical protein